MARTIVHLDADAFFASVEQAADPRLRGRPVAVGGEQRGIIACASYEARKFGIHTPMPTARARKLCPHLILLPGDFERYEQFSRWMFSYLHDFTPAVEISSIDEGYFDLTGARRPPREIAETVRRAIGEGLKISVSEGIGANKLVSQIASKLRKPAAMLQVRPGEETAFLHPLPHRWLPGIGPRTALRLEAAGLARIGQVAATPVDCLALLVGAAAPRLREFANGIDDRPLILERAAAQSYCRQHTFDEDVIDEARVEATLRRMADQVMAAVRADGKLIRTVTVKVRYNDRDEQQRSESLPEPTDVETDLYGRLRPMLRQAWQRRVSLRMVSLKVSNLYAAYARSELALAGPSRTYDARRRLANTVAEVRQRYGARALMRGHDLPLDGPASPGRARPPRANPAPPPRRPRPAPAALPVPLHVHSYYSFLDSTLSPRDIVDWAARHDCPAVALTDTANLHGAVPFVQAAQAAGIKPVIGTELVVDGRPLLLYVENRTGYANLCRILTRHGDPAGGADAASLFPCDTAGLIAVAADERMAHYFAPDAFYLGCGRPPAPRLRPRSSAQRRVAAPAVHYAAPEDRRAYDILQSIRTLTLLDQPHPAKRGAEAGPFRPPAAVRDAFQADPDLSAHTREIADRCAFAFEFGRLQFPAFHPPDGSTPHGFLRGLVRRGCRDKYGARPALRDRVCRQIDQELTMIAEVGYEEYFLVVWDLLRRCRERGIEWLTRGSAADSLVCYCLDISDVCPVRFDLYFQRFLNRERMQMNKLPDIDVDFPHDRKDDVIDLLFETYGPEHTAVVGGFSTFQSRSALADVAKVLGVADHQVRQLTRRLPYYSRAGDLPELMGRSVECRDLPAGEEPFRTALQLARFLDGFPRHPKMHPCGVVLSRQPLVELTPCFRSAKHYPTTQFDMDAVEDIGLVKIDVLAQGGLAAIRDVRAMLRARGVALDLRAMTARSEDGADLVPPPPPDTHPPTPPSSDPWTDPRVWDLIAAGHARAVHHIESPAMTSLCRMCNVRDIDTLIAVVSVIRPGAANTHKKKHFTLRYQGMEPVTYPHPSLEACLKTTFGMLVYEEQVLQICDAFTGMPPGDADRLRRALNKRDWDKVKALGRIFYEHALRRGRAVDDIRAVWRFLCSFNGYAFCKAHSTAYGVEAYQSAWLKCYFPAEFMAAVLTNGKGFYPTLVYILECHRLGLRVLPPRVNDPGPGYQVRDGHAIRVPVGAIKGITDEVRQRILTEHARGPFVSLCEFYRRVHPAREDGEILLRAGALDDFASSRTRLFWEIQWLLRAFGDRAQGALFTREPDHPTPSIELTEPTRLDRLRAEQELLGFPVSGHPLDLYPDIAWDTYCPVAELHRRLGERVVCCGLVVIDRVVVHDNGDSMKFLTLADYTGLVETELFANVYQRYGLATVRYPVLEVAATVEPFDNAHGFTLNIHRAGQPRLRPEVTRRTTGEGEESD